MIIDVYPSDPYNSLCSPCGMLVTTEKNGETFGGIFEEEYKEFPSVQDAIEELTEKGFHFFD